MTDQSFINLISIVYFAVMGSVGFYLLWREWQWTKKEALQHEKRTVPTKSQGQ